MLSENFSCTLYPSIAPTGLVARYPLSFMLTSNCIKVSLYRFRITSVDVISLNIANDIRYVQHPPLDCEEWAACAKSTP
jgi:hypothetical protein